MARVYRRGKVYWARVQRQGREYRRSLKTENRKVAERRLRSWLDDLDAIAWGDKPRRTFDEAAERFVREHLTSIKPSSARRYGISLKHLAEHFGGKTLDLIKSAALSEFETKRRAQGKTAGTVRRDLACLSSLLTSCEEWEWIDDGANQVPAYMRRRAKRGLKEAPPHTRYLTEGEEDLILSCATPAGLLNEKGRQAGKWTCVRETITVAIDTGLRREELFSLQWRQIDFGRRLITTTTMTKSGRIRFVPLPERSAQILAQFPRALDCPFVFVNPDTGTRYLAMEKGFKAAARRANVTNVRWHDLRRTAGCRWLQRDGRTMAEVSMMLGHSSIAVTENRYAFLEAEDVAASMSGRTEVGTRTADVMPLRKASQ
jgi:integrase